LLLMFDNYSNTEKAVLLSDCGDLRFGKCECFLKETEKTQRDGKPFGGCMELRKGP